MLACRRWFPVGFRLTFAKEDTAIATGTVKWYDLEKGYGFVYEDNANRDVFLHSADIQEPEPKILYEGHRVSFEVEESERGPRAVEVRVITGTERPDEDAEDVAVVADEPAAEQE